MQKCNLFTGASETTADLRVLLPGGKTVKIVKTSSQLPQTPLMYNPKMIKKHTRLTFYDDGELKRLADKEKQAATKQKAAEEKKQKDAAANALEDAAPATKKPKHSD